MGQPGIFCLRQSNKRFSFFSVVYLTHRASYEPSSKSGQRVKLVSGSAPDQPPWSSSPWGPAIRERKVWTSCDQRLFKCQRRTGRAGATALPGDLQRTVKPSSIPPVDTAAEEEQCFQCTVCHTASHQRRIYLTIYSSLWIHAHAHIGIRFFPPFFRQFLNHGVSPLAPNLFVLLTVTSWHCHTQPRYFNDIFHL